MSESSYIHRVADKVAYVLGDDLSYFAASLSFYTIFSIIPMLWVTFYVLSSFEAFSGYYSEIKNFLVYNLIPTHTDAVGQYLDGFLANSKQMGFWGLVYILLASILFYRNYQYVVNKIFHIENQSFWHAIETYLILSFLMPVTLGGSFYLSDYIQRAVGDVGQSVGLFTVLSYLLIWLLFFVVFKVSPSMPIKHRVAIFVSFIISLVWQIAKTAYVYYVVANQTYVSLYGSFSVLLFFLLWIYLSWFMLLHGLRMCYLLQSRMDKIMNSYR
jgi:membrane protein